MGVSLARIVQFSMRLFSIFLLVVASVQGEAEADAHTLSQVARGLNYYGIVTGVDYGGNTVTGYEVFGNRGLTYGIAPGYPRIPYTNYAKRDAEAEPYTISQVFHGLPVADAYATGHSHNVGYIAYTSYPATDYNNYPHAYYY